MLDLAVVVPDKAIEQAITGLLEHPRKLGIRPVRSRILSHSGRDPGCYETGHELLTPFSRTASHGLVIFDKAWDGAPAEEAPEIERGVLERLRPTWDDRARCIVIDPEVEAWLWTDSPHLCETLGWSGSSVAQLRAWIAEQGLWPADSAKPSDPKEAFHRAARHGNVPPSSAIFRELAGRVSYGRCRDRSFRTLTAVLRGWFPQQHD
jgi:hypothetical protein